MKKFVADVRRDDGGWVQVYAGTLDSCLDLAAQLLKEGFVVRIMKEER